MWDITIYLRLFPGVGQAAPRQASARACSPGRFWAVPHYRVSPVAPARGLFRIDESGDEYGGGTNRNGNSSIRKAIMRTEREAGEINKS